MSTVTRRDFIKTAAGGTAGLAFLGSAAVAGSTYATYLPKGGSRMNVVVVNLGNLRRDHVGAYGNEWIKTPSLDALAEDSLRFTRPSPESIPTLDGRRTIYTGTRTWPFRGWRPSAVGNRPAGSYWIPEDQSSFTETLTANEYTAALVTDTYPQFEPSMNFHRGFSAFDFIRGQELDRLASTTSVSESEVDRLTVPGNDEAARSKARQHLANRASRSNTANKATRADEEDHFTPTVFRRSMEYLEQVSKVEGPFFLMVDSFDPHEPWDPPELYRSMYGDPIGRREPAVPNYGESGYLEEAELRRMRELYAGEVTMTDRWLGELVNKLDELSLLDETLLIAFSDHGVALGEHGYTGKVPEALWPELTGNVLYIRHPSGRGAGQTSGYRASLQDLAPTILGVAGGEQETEGQDLGVILSGGEPEHPRSRTTLGFGNYSWAEDEDHALAVRNDGSEARLYDLREDPEMHDDISSGNQDIVRRMYEDYIVADAGGEPPPLYESSEIY
ncbi:sulfatase [Rubrobacter aplysinae]|uniref:sulfatase n=1 Tax=Rubrobacter aplysinae TaxID=909625 RepID=UPI00069DFD35|nr:sulfatase [Rubrobacter aplysinae]